MNLPNKLTVLRLILSVVIIILLVFPFYAVGIQFPTFNISGISSPVESQYFIAGIIFIIASVTDFLDGRIARKYNLITDTGKMLDAIADKVLVNSVLIICSLHLYYTIGKGIFQMNYLKNLFLPNNTLFVYANSSLIILIAITTTIKTAESISTIASPLHRTMPIHSIIPL